MLGGFHGGQGYSAAATGSCTLTGSLRSVGTRTAYPQAKSPNDKLNIGIIGCGGKGYSDMKGCEGENIVALCDVDENSGGQARKDHPDAKFYHNFRF